MTNPIINKLKSLKNKSNHYQHKLSALVLLKGRPLSAGFNDITKTHPKIKKYSEVKTMHAEMSAIFRVKDKSILKNCTLVVYRENKDGTMALAKPCSICEQMIKDYGITEVIYSSPEGWIYV